MRNNFFDQLFWELQLLNSSINSLAKREKTCFLKKKSGILEAGQQVLLMYHQKQAVIPLTLARTSLLALSKCLLG